MAETESISEAFEAIVELAQAMGVSKINQLPGCWEVQVDDQWRISLNGHAEPTKDSLGHEVPPYHCSVDFNGWPAGIFSPKGGIIAAGAAANEDALIEALRKKTREVAGP